MVPFPDLELILSEIQARRDWVGAVGHSEFAGIELIPANFPIIALAVTSVELADSLCDCLYGDVLRLAPSYANGDFSEASVPALTGVYPDRIDSLKKAVSYLTGKLVKSMAVADRFRIGGFVSLGVPLAAYTLPTHTPDGSLLISQRLTNVTGDGVELRDDLRFPGSQVTFVKSQTTLPARVVSANHFWSACSGGIDILAEETGQATGRRVVTFQLARESEFTYLLARRDLPVESQSFIDNLSMEISSSEGAVSSESTQVAETCCGCDQDLVDARAPLLTIASVDRSNAELSEMTGHSIPSDSWQTLGETGEVPTWTRSVVVSLNDRVLPPPDQIMDVTNLLIDGQNLLVIEYDGIYGWSDLVLLECVSVSLADGDEPPPTISYRCLCFKYLGYLDTFQRGYCSTASVGIDAEAIAIGQFELMQPLKTPAWRAALTCRPAMVFRDQLVRCSFGIDQQATSWELGFIYKNYGTGSEVWEPLMSGIASDAHSKSVSFTIPRSLPSYRWVILALRVDGVETNTFSMFSFGNNFCGDWRFLRTTQRLTNSWCCQPESSSSIDSVSSSSLSSVPSMSSMSSVSMPSSSMSSSSMPSSSSSMPSSSMSSMSSMVSVSSMSSMPPSSV